MKIKVCGMRDAGNIERVAELRPDYMGFIFYDKSPRFCRGLSPDVVKGLPSAVKPVMVAVDMEEDEIMRITEKYGFAAVQLHGRELPELCFSLRSRGLEVIKAMGMRSEESLKMLAEYGGAVDHFLLDTYCPGKGGSGKQFDRSILDAYSMEEDFFLSGGIGIEDAEAIKAGCHPRCIGVDVNSRFESTPGFKDVGRLSEFIRVIRK